MKIRELIKQLMNGNLDSEATVAIYYEGDSGEQEHFSIDCCIADFNGSVQIKLGSDAVVETRTVIRKVIPAPMVCFDSGCREPHPHKSSLKTDHLPSGPKPDELPTDHLPKMEPLFKMGDRVKIKMLTEEEVGRVHLEVGFGSEMRSLLGTIGTIHGGGFTIENTFDVRSSRPPSSGYDLWNWPAWALERA